MAIRKNGIVVLGAVFVDIKGFPEDIYIPDGRNAGTVEYVHGGVSRNVVEDIANLELRPTFLGIVDDSALGEDVIHKLKNHKVNTEYMQTIPIFLHLHQKVLLLLCCFQDIRCNVQVLFYLTGSHRQLPLQGK